MQNYTITRYIIFKYVLLHNLNISISKNKLQNKSRKLRLITFINLIIYGDFKTYLQVLSVKNYKLIILKISDQALKGFI